MVVWGGVVWVERDAALRVHTLAQNKRKWDFRVFFVHGASDGGKDNADFYTKPA